MDVEEPRPATPEPASVVAAALADAASADGIADGLEEDQAKDQAGAEEAALAGPGDMEAEAEDGEGGGGAGEDDDEAPPTPKRRKNMAGDITIPKGSVKRVIKLDKDVRLVSAEAVLAISKATEFFLERLSMRAHEHSADDAEEPGVIKYQNVVKAQTTDPSCDFLNDLFKYWNPNQDAPSDEQNQGGFNQAT